MNKLLNVLCYQAIWFLCVLGGNRGAWVGLLLVGLHLGVSTRKKADLRLLALLAFLGVLVDGSLIQLGFFSFPHPGRPLPFWLWVIWLGLAITPQHSLAWMASRPFLALLFGAVGGPAAYWAGVRLGAADFQWSLGLSLGTLSVLWAFVWAGIMAFSLRLGTPKPAVPPPMPGEGKDP